MLDAMTGRPTLHGMRLIEAIAGNANKMKWSLKCTSTVLDALLRFISKCEIVIKSNKSSVNDEN